MQGLTLGEVATLVQGEVRGDPEHRVTAVCGLDGMVPGALTFAENARALRDAEASTAGAVLLPPDLSSHLPGVAVRQPRVAFAIMLGHVYPRSRPAPGVHPTASVDPAAHVPPTAHVGPRAVVAAGATIGEGCEIGARAVVGTACQVGEGTRLQPGVLLGDGARLGRQCLVGALTWIGPGTEVGDDVEIGARCLLEGCSIASGARIDNLVRVHPGARVGEHAILVAQALVAAGATVGRYSIVAGQGYVMEGRTVGDLAQVGARGRVEADLPPGQAAWAGDPVLPHKEELRREALRSRALDLHHRVLRRRRP